MNKFAFQPFVHCNVRHALLINLEKKKEATNIMTQYLQLLLPCKLQVVIFKTLKIEMQHGACLVKHLYETCTQNVGVELQVKTP